MDGPLLKVNANFYLALQESLQNGMGILHNKLCPLVPWGVYLRMKGDDDLTDMC